uniref:bifunctional folylpolyglutamate synthase/dihydrofolate synthase n=1 Tax=Prevotellamassilia timonensis TaxID=1852370 RepID=UPI00402732F8
MTYDETIQYLFNSAPLFQHVGGAAYKEGLSTTHILDAHFNHPHNQYKTIHIAGTNGKGSCAHTIAAILQHTGLKVGLYTSPHLVDFRERIRINGEMMPQQYVIDFVEKERSFFEPLHPSFFELTTALAFKYFAEQHVDVAVIEVGLGGRLDCTNIISPILSIITNISFDHTQFLGNTLAQIASEKAGIIKHKVPVIIGECNAETRSVFEHKAHEVEAPILFAEDNKEVLSSEFSDLYGHKLRHYTTRSFGDIYGELTGECQIKNANTILCALHSLSKIFSVTHEDITYAFEHVCEMTGLRGRWQILQEHPTIICDTGHNTGGWQYLAHQLAQIATSANKLHIVFGIASDKE